MASTYVNKLITQTETNAHSSSFPINANASIAIASTPPEQQSKQYCNISRCRKAHMAALFGSGKMCNDFVFWNFVKSDLELSSIERNRARHGLRRVMQESPSVRELKG